MSSSLKKSLRIEDFNEAVESLKFLIKGIPIKDETGQLIGYIEKPDLNAIKFVLSSFDPDEVNPSKNISGKH